MPLTREEVAYGSSDGTKCLQISGAQICVSPKAPTLEEPGWGIRSLFRFAVVGAGGEFLIGQGGCRQQTIAVARADVIFLQVLAVEFHLY